MNIGIFTINSNSNLNELNDNTDVHIPLTSISVKRKNVSYTDARPSFFFLVQFARVQGTNLKISYDNFTIILR